MKKYYVKTATIDIPLTRKQWENMMAVLKESGEWEKIGEKPITFRYKGLVEITREEAREVSQYFVYNPLTQKWMVYSGDDKKGIAYFKYASELLKYYKVEE